ncbi:hypothetical protein [Tardiphaga sp.]|uniref:hypothetical protein n=1 Tax=Tardiphaga sp. TaxID=1926292 RepID=UPI002620EA01|nr:hypothetical protein [Tardiphaga sp.]MDB5618380.1 hypothetical protein [Tardiphaga sp.]
MASMFWKIATSDYALAFDTIVFVLALLVSGVDKIATWLPWLKPYTAWGRPVSYIALGALALSIGHRLSDESAELARVKIDLAFSNLQLETQRQTADTAARLRTEAEASAATANQKVTDYEERLSKLPTACGCDLDDSARRRSQKRVRASISLPAAIHSGHARCLHHSATTFSTASSRSRSR